MPLLSHLDIQELGRTLGYPFTGGLCHGFSCMLIQAILSGEEEAFWKRLQLIESFKDDFSALKIKIDEVSNVNDIQKWELLEILVFYAGIELYLNPQNHQDVFNKKNIYQASIAAIYDLVYPTKSGVPSLLISLDKNYAGNKDGLANYLNDLEKILSNYSNLPLIITSSRHSVLLKYNSNKAKKPWRYVDTNDFKRYPENLEYYRELSTKELVNSLFKSFKDPEHIVFNMKLVTPSTHPINQDEALKGFEIAYQINEQQALLYDKNEVGLLYMACKMGHIKDVEFLLAQQSIEINKATQKSGATPFYVACEGGHSQIVRLLLGRDDLDINHKRRDKSNAFFIACQFGHVEIVRLLAQKGVAINHAILDKSTALFIACQYGQVEVVAFLVLFKGIELNKANKYGATPLYIACQFGHIEIVALLLQQKEININKAKKGGWTALCVACDFGQVEVVALLLTNKTIKINKATDNKDTPLHIACLKGQTAIVTLLLQTNQADLCLKNKQGMSAMDIAFSQNNSAIIEALLMHAKKNNLSLSKLMSSETLTKAREWATTKCPHTNDFFTSNLLDLKNFVQVKLERIEQFKNSVK